MADVSHELRTPLTTIRGIIEGMKNNMISESEKEKGLGLAAMKRCDSSVLSMKT